MAVLSSHFFIITMPFAGAVTITPPDLQQPSFRSVTYNVRDFGALGDGKTPDTAPINKAIERCNSQGGGDVVFPPGTYLSATIHLLSHVRLVIQTGAEILGAPSGYDVAEPNPNNHFQDGGHSIFTTPCSGGRRSKTAPLLATGKSTGKALRCSIPNNPTALTKCSRSSQVKISGSTISTSRTVVILPGSSMTVRMSQSPA